MKLLQILIVTACSMHMVHAQELEQSALVDAGRVVVDIIKLFKKDKSNKNELIISEPAINTCESLTAENLCFINNGKEDLHVFLITSDLQPDTTEFYINHKGEECAYSIAAGIYTYIVDP